MTQTVSRVAATVLPLLLLACGARPHEARDAAAFLSWARAHATRVETEGLGPAAKATLRRATRSVRLIGLGESRHDAREQTLLKADMVRFLVSEQGCRTLILEESLPHAERLDACIADPDVDARAALAALAGWYLWETEEMLELVEWLQDFNASRPTDDLVRVFGVDITAPAPATRRVLLALHLSGLAGRLNEDSLALPLHAGDSWPLTRERFGSLPAAERDALRRHHAELSDLLVNERSTLLERLSVAEHGQLLALARLASDGNEFFCTEDGVAAGLIRERSMAANTLRLLASRAADGPAVLWAHDLHVTKAPFHVADFGDAAVESMGVRLARELGASYLAIGGSFGSGRYPGQLPPGERLFERLPVATMDGALAQVGPARFLLDWRALPQDPALISWLEQERPWRAQDKTALLPSRRAFDLVYFVDEITRSAPLPAALERLNPS